MIKKNQKISVIIPAHNEQEAIALVINDLPRHLVDEIIVVDNNSTDSTANTARKAGARVVFEEHIGYGAACLKGIACSGNPDIIVFIDGDYSDYPNELEKIIAPLCRDEADLVIGSRLSGTDEKRVLPLHAYWGNKVTTWLIQKIYNHSFTDLGPFRAIRFQKLQQLEMTDKNFGWTVEMQIKAVKMGISIVEVPVRYRKRVGKSKISGTMIGSVKAGLKILYTVFSLI